MANSGHEFTKGMTVSRFRRALFGSVATAALLVPAGVAQAAAPVHHPLDQAVSAAHQKHATSTLSAGNWVIDFYFVRDAGQTVFGCKYGYACLYTDAGAATNTPEHSYVHYGCYNLSNELGHRDLVNNQYGGATVTLYTGYNCVGPTFTSQEAEVDDGDITPINSLRLSP
jgi:hypothetical protein